MEQETQEVRSQVEGNNNGIDAASAAVHHPKVICAPGTPQLMRSLMGMIELLALPEPVTVFIMPRKYMTTPRNSAYARKMLTVEQKVVIVWDNWSIQRLDERDIMTYLSAVQAKPSVTGSEQVTENES